jgi:acetolactate synthase-1/2/3 large subunit
MIKLSDYVFSFLANKGIKHVFMLPGGGAMHLVDSLGLNQDVEYLCPRHEQAAAIAAEGYYRASNKICAVVVTSGPGGTNTLTGVIGQWLDSIPCIYISGQLKKKMIITACSELKLRQLGDQEINIVDIITPVTKYAVTVMEPDKIKYHLEKAFYIATHGRPGPVWLDVPLDIQSSVIEPAELTGYNESEDEIVFDEDLIKKQIAELLDRIKKAQRPVLMAGHGIRIAGAENSFLQLVDKLNIPVVTAICGHDLIWSDHPLFFGRPGICGDRISNIVQQNSDLFLAIGARLGVRQISYSYDTFAREAYRAMVDIDPSEMNKPTLNLHMRVHADAKLFIEEMLRQISYGNNLGPKEKWLSWCRERKNTLPSILQDNPSNSEYVNSYAFVDCLFNLLEPGALVVTGNGTANTCTMQTMRLKKDVRFFTNQGCASMGYDLPAAIGACLARNRQQTILLTGDGSIQMNIQELGTIVFHNLPIKIFVLNNEGYLAQRITQDTYFEGRYTGSGRKDGVYYPNISQVAEAFGLKTVKLNNENNLSRKIRQVLDMPGPVLCEVRMDPKQTLYPKLSSEVRSDGTMVSKPLEDLYPFLPREEFRKHMIIKSIQL